MKLAHQILCKNSESSIRWPGAVVLRVFCDSKMLCVIEAIKGFFERARLQKHQTNWIEFCEYTHTVQSKTFNQKCLIATFKSHFNSKRGWKCNSIVQVVKRRRFVVVQALQQQQEKNDGK